MSMGGKPVRDFHLVTTQDSFLALYSGGSEKTDSRINWQFKNPCFSNILSLLIYFWEWDQTFSMMNTGIILQLTISFCLPLRTSLLSSISQYFSRPPWWISAGQSRPLAIDPVGGLGQRHRGRCGWCTSGNSRDCAYWDEWVVWWDVRSKVFVEL